jgi:hypothetical protein
MSYALGANGSAVNLANLSGNNNASQVNPIGQGSMSSSGYLQAPSSAPFGSYHSMDNQEAASDNFRQ